MRSNAEKLAGAHSALIALELRRSAYLAHIDELKYQLRQWNLEVELTDAAIDEVQERIEKLEAMQ